MQVSLTIIWKTGYFAYPFSWVIFVRGLSLIMKCGGAVVYVLACGWYIALYCDLFLSRSCR